MPTKSLPERPNLAQLRLQAKELQHLFAEGRRSAAARILAHHPRLATRDTQSILRAPLKLSDAQLVIAREHGFASWAALKHIVETGKRVAQYSPHPRFADAVAAIDAGDLDGLRDLLDAHPELVRARTNLEPPFGYFTGATLLHHLAWNPGRQSRVPANVAEIGRLLLARGADVAASTLGRNGGTTMGLVITSKMASDANVSGLLMDLLLAHGAHLDLGSPDRASPGKHSDSVLDGSLSNYAIRAAERMIELGARADVCAAAALGRMDLLREMFTPDGRLRERPVRHGKRLSERDAIGLALLFAYVNKRPETQDFLLERDGNWNMIGVNNGTALHRAAWEGDLPMLQRLVARGADTSNRDNPWNSTPLSWAQHNQQQHVFDWLRANVALDLHDAVCHNLREHTEARLREDPSSVHVRRDQWEVPRTTPLYWAAWNQMSDVGGAHMWDESDREYLVQLLLDHGADPNAVAGDGNAPLDVARAAGVRRVVALLETRGARSAADL